MDAAPSRSVPAGEVVRQVRRPGRSGATREVVLTGVDITAYGADLPGAMTLGKLVKTLLKLVPNSTGCGSPQSTPSRPTGDLLDAIAEEPR